MKAWNYITIDFEGQEYSLIVQIIVKADRGKAISQNKTQFLMVLINTKQNLPFLGSLWGIELRFSLSHHVEFKFFLTISSCSNKVWNKQFPFPSLSETIKPMSDTALLNSSVISSVGTPLLLYLLSVIACFNFLRFLVISPGTPKVNKYLCCERQWKTP